MAAQPRLVVGIDLGTTHTAVAWSRLDDHGPARILDVPQLVAAGQVAAQPLLPSVLYAPVPEEAQPDPWQDAPWVIGEHARQRGQQVPGRLVASAKSWLCHGAVDRTAPILPWGVAEDEAVPRVSPVEASRRILAHVARAYGEAFPDQPLHEQQIVVTVPASFDQVARELTLRAAHEAGLVVRLLEEPQAAFYAFVQQAGTAALDALLHDAGETATVLVCDVGGGTTDLTLIQLGRDRGGALSMARSAVGRHLLLGGDNMDLALAHLCEPRLTRDGERLEPRRFGQLIHCCRSAKERLLGRDPPEQVPISILGAGSTLVGSALRTELGRSEVEQVILDGFLAPAERDEQPQRRRTALVGFGLPYEQDPAITRHVASFFARHCADVRGPHALLLNGGLFRAARAAERVTEVIQSWGGPQLHVLEPADPDLAVARGAVAYGLALHGRGLQIGGGAAPGATWRQAVCVLPRGAREGERHLAASRPLALRVGSPVRFDLYASDSHAAAAPGEVVSIDDEQYQRLPPVTTTFDLDQSQGPDELQVVLEGELSAIGTLELACVEAAVHARQPRRFRLAFELRATEARAGSEPPVAAATPRSAAPGSAATRSGQRLDAARQAIDRVFGKSRKDVRVREIKDLLRELERLLGPRAGWTTELARALFDELVAQHRARRRSPDHERFFWLLGGYCLRPGFGHPRDPQRIQMFSPLFREGVVFQQETRGWQQFFIAWRRVAAGLGEAVQKEIRDRLDPFLAPPDAKLKRPKGFKPTALHELLETASWMERVAAERRVLLGRWIVDRTWTDRDPRLWAAIGRLGARVPAYASVHHVVSPRTAERWLDHLLREKWSEMPTAPLAALQLARVTNDRARDVSEATRATVAQRLEQVGAKPEWVEAVRRFVPVQEADRADLFGEDLPVGLRLLDGSGPGAADG
jgi:molecular chaperone DnaK (HSP70)